MPFELTLVAPTALNTLSGAGLGAVTRSVAMLLAVLAGKGIEAFLLAVAGTVTKLLTVHALDLGTNRTLLALFLAVLADVAKLCDEG